MKQLSLYNMIRRYKKTVQLIAGLCLAASMVNAQQPGEVYARQLGEVMDQLEKKYSISFRYEDDQLRDKTVQYAQWRLTQELGSTLDNVLKPLDLVYTKQEGNVYLIKPYYYYRRTEAAGRAHLDALLKAYPDAAAFDQRKKELRQCVSAALGIHNFSNRTALNPIVRTKKQFDGYTTENIAFESIPGYFVTGTVYKPLKGKGPFPVILNPHGHFFNEQDPPSPKDSSRYRADMQIRCATLARMGAIVLSYDMYAWGESAQMTGGMQYHETGFAAAIQTWNSIRALDYLLTLPGADATRVGVTGASGGGTQAFLLAALDDRVTVSVPVVMVSSSFYGGCPCESGLPVHADCKGNATNNTELAALVAPKPLLVISDGDDWTTSVPGTDYPYLQKIYGYYGKTANVESVYLPQDKHDYGLSKRLPAYRFLATGLGLNLKAVQDKEGNISEARITIVTNDELRVFNKENPLPATALRSHSAIMEMFKKVQAQ